MKIKIEKNKEIPKKKTRKKYPFEEMEIGDSFIYGKYTAANMRKLSNAARNWAKQAGKDWRFEVRKEDNKNRIWRVK